MDDDNAPRGVVDPEVRAYVYSLVSAVYTTAVPKLLYRSNTKGSLGALALMKKAAMFLVTMHWHV